MNEMYIKGDAIKAIRIKLFLADLKKIKAKWTTGIDGCLRARIKGKSYCPMTAVALLRLGKFYKSSQWVRAAQALGEDIFVAEELVNAADPGYLGEVDRKLRNAMLAACGIKWERDE